MQLGYRIACFLAAAVMLVHAAHAAPAATEELRADSGAAIVLGQAASHAPECVDSERSCGRLPAAIAPAHAFQPGAMVPAGRLALFAAVPAMAVRVVPRASPPLSILFRNFRS